MSIKSTFDYPGTISIALRDGQYPGAKAKWFWTVSGYNRFFTEKEGQPGHGFLVTDVQHVSYFFGLLVGVMVHYTSQLSPKEKAYFLQATKELEYKMMEMRQEEEAKEEEAQRVNVAAQEEVQRLAAVGSKYEARTKHRRTLPPSSEEYKEIEKALNSGDVEVLFKDKAEAFAAGYVHGHRVQGEAIAALRVELDKLKAFIEKGPQS